MQPINHSRLTALIKQLYETVSELESMFPGRHFTPDGHMVGSLGECLVADAYGLELKKASTKGHDAVSRSGLEVEIKATQANSVAFRSEPQHVIVVKIMRDGTFEEIFNGPGSLVWAQFSGKRLPDNGQFQIRLSKLQELNRRIAETDRISRLN